MTPDSPVSGLIRLNFSQDNIKLVSRVFGTQVVRRSFQPFGCSRRLCKTYMVINPVPYKTRSARRGIPLHPCCGGPSGSRRASRRRSRIAQISLELSSLGWKGWNYTQNFHRSS